MLLNKPEMKNKTMKQNEQAIPNWDTCYVSGTITACDPGCNHSTHFPKSYRRDEIKIGKNLCSYNSYLPAVTVQAIHDDHIVVGSMGARKELYPGQHFFSPKKGLSYAYSEAIVSIERPDRSIRIEFETTEEDLTGKSKWWGCADLPEGHDYPFDEDGNPLMFICQIRCEEMTEYDMQFKLPRKGMLYFFADIDEYMSAFAEFTGAHNGLGEWPEDKFRVIYAEDCSNLKPCPRVYNDDTPAYLPAKAIKFSLADVKHDSYKLLGKPYYEEIEQELPDEVCLLQIDESDEFGLTLYDCGMMCFMISPRDMAYGKWEKARFYFHSF